jgi:hypothetical protein
LSHDFVAERGGELGVVNTELGAVLHGAAAGLPISQTSSAAKNGCHAGMIAARAGSVILSRACVRARARPRAQPHATRRAGPTRSLASAGEGVALRLRT